MENWRRYTLLFIGFLESLIFSGIIFGWASLLFILQQENIYSHLCEEDSENRENSGPSMITNHRNGSVGGGNESAIDEMTLMSATERIPTRCATQSNEFTLIYTVAATMHGMASVLIGFSLDRFGLWATRLTGSAMLVAGFFCLAFTRTETPWLLWPAMNLVSLGSNQLKLCNYQFTNLWPQRRSTILFVYGSGFAISTAVFTLLQHLYTSGISYKFLTLSLASVSVLTIPATFLMPLMKVATFYGPPVRREVGSDKGGTKALENDAVRMEQAKELLPMGPQGGASQGIQDCEVNEIDGLQKKNSCNYDNNDKTIPLSHSLLTLSAALHFLWQFVSLFMILFYSVSFNSWMYKSTDDPDQVAHYTKVMGICQLIGPVITPISGIFTDWRVKVANKYNDPVETVRLSLQAPAFACLLTSFLLALLMTCKMLVSRTAIYLSMFLIAISRPMTHSSCASFVRLRFPEDHFNRLNGIFTTAVAAVMFVQYPVFVWMFSSDENYRLSNIVLLLSLLLSLLSPLHLMNRKISRRYAIQYLQVIGRTQRLQT